MDTRESQSLSTPAIAEGVSEPSILVKACQCLESNGKVLTEEAKMHMTGTKVKYSYTGHPRIASSSCRAKSWDLNYPAISFMLNRGYDADYANIMGTMGLSTMHHSTWDNLVSWVGPHVEWLANWSCEQVRADIEKRGDQSQWMAGFDGFYLARGHHSNPPLHCMMCIQIELPGLHIVPSVVKILTGEVHYLVPRDLRDGY